MSDASYFDTTLVIPESRKKEYEAIAGEQEREILRFYFRHAHIELSPSYVWRTLLPNVPLTSVRRAITCLTNQGWLVKTPAKVNGYYGRPEFCWKARLDITPDNAQQMKLNLEGKWKNS